MEVFKRSGSLNPWPKAIFNPKKIEIRTVKIIFVFIL
jgi:hypothetical protein